MNRILFEAEELAADGRVAISDQRARHLRQVLRVEPGQSVRVGVIDGPLGQASVAAIDGRRVELVCCLEETRPPRPAVDLLLALPRPKVMGRLWPVLSSLGLGRIILTNAWRVERSYFDTHWLAEGVYRPRLIEGLAQAGCTRLPEVSVHKRLVALLEDGLPGAGPTRLPLLAHARGGRRPAAVIAAAAPARVLLAVGPEGGWIDQELELFARHGFSAIRTGDRILRSDVACAVLIGLVHDALAAG